MATVEVKCLFCQQRQEHSTIKTMRTIVVVIAAQILCDIPYGIMDIQIPFRGNPFTLQAAKDSLHWGIIPAISPSAHALDDFVSP